MKYSKFIFLLAATVFLATTQLSLAASLYIDPGVSTINRGDSLNLAVRLDIDEAAGECVNAVDAVINYSDNIEPVDISTGDSIFSIWVERPTINKQERTITFAGGIPNGYCGRVAGDPRLSNVITEIVFRSPGFVVGAGATDNKKATVGFNQENTIVYLNDGKGTQVSPTVYPATIELNSGLGSSISNPWQEEVNADSIPPAEFAISIQKDDKAFSQKWFIVFNSNDKQTGIDHYEVIEEPIAQFGTFKWGEATAPWTVERSPYVLKDQTLNSIIRVKAVDKAGNEYVSTVIPDEANRTLSLGLILTIVVIGALVLLVLTILIVVIKRYRSKRKLAKEIINNENSHDENN